MYKLKTLLIAFIILSAFTTLAQVSSPDTLGPGSKNFSLVEEEAYYPGGNAAWQKFLQENLQADIPINNMAPIGKYTAIVQFIVDIDGSVSEVKAVTKFGYGMEEEVRRVIEHSGKWMPAIQDGSPIRAYRKQPITFILDSEDFKIITAEEYTLFTNTDNEITVKARKVKAADIAINVKGGKAVALGEGKFTVKVTKPGRVLIEVVNSKKNDKEIGVANLEVIAR